MEELKIKTPAKINFGLRVVRKRPDGYHDIETIFYPVNLFDILTITTSDKFIFNSNNIRLKNESNNSVIKAVMLLENLCDRKFNIKIFLEKNIPVGAGMGGGSSDGAAALIALNKFYGLELSNDKLKKLALEIGSDAPFFIEPAPSFAEHRGEKIQKINFRIPFPILIVNPGIHISTKWAYENITLTKHADSFRDLKLSKDSDFSNLRNIVKNNFEEIVFEKHPEIKNIKDELYHYGAAFALMTGSGSTVYGIFPDINSAQIARDKFPGNYFTFIHHL